MLQKVKADECFQLPENTISLDEYVSRAKHIERIPGEPVPDHMWQEWEEPPPISRVIKRESPIEEK